MISSRPLNHSRPFAKPAIHFGTKKRNHSEKLKTSSGSLQSQPAAQAAQFPDTMAHVQQRLARGDAPLSIVYDMAPKTTNPQVMGALVDILRSNYSRSLFGRPTEEPVDKVRFSKTNYTLLHAAISRGEPALVEVLLNGGASPLKLTGQSQNAFDLVQARIAEKATDAEKAPFIKIQALLNAWKAKETEASNAWKAANPLLYFPFNLIAIAYSGTMGRLLSRAGEKVPPEQEAADNELPAPFVLTKQDMAVQTDSDGFEALQEAHQTLQLAFQAQQDTLQTLNAELSRLKTLQIQHTESQNRIQKLQAELEQVRAKTTKFEEASRGSESERQKRELQLKALKAANQRLQKELEVEQKTIQSLKQQLDAQRAAASEILSAKEKQLKDAEARNEARIDLLKQQIEALKAQLAKPAESKKSKVPGGVDSPGTPSLTEKLNRLSRERDQLSRERQSLQAQLENTKAEFTKLEEQSQVLQQKNSAQEKELKKLLNNKKKNAGKIAEVTASLQESQREIENLSAQQVELQKKNEAATLVKQELLEELYKLKKRCETLEAQLQQMAAKYKEAEQKTQALKAINHFLAHHNVSSQEYIKNQQTALNHLQLDIQKLRADLQEKEIKNLQLTAALTEAKKTLEEIEELKEKISQFNKTFPKLELLDESGDIPANPPQLLSIEQQKALLERLEQLEQQVAQSKPQKLARSFSAEF